jgi:hypothetical protein
MAQWTPEQLVGVADHALKSNRVEDAINVYRYLSQSFPGTPEAEFAASEIERLSAPVVDAEQQPVNGREPALRRPGSGRRDPGAALNGHDPGPRPSARRPRSERVSADGADRRPEQSEPVHSVAVREGPAYVRDYKAGTLVSRVVAGLGWLVLVIAGVAALIGWTCIGLAQFGIWQPNHSLLQQLMILAAPSLGAALGGLFAIAFGQAMRALFDQSNATRELLAIRQRY